jgi:hydroxymethylpyrimidine pyrophosphatase-like HAD family hydrolase
VIIAIDFDGTIVKHVYPEIGEIIPLAIETMKYLSSQGHKLILYTMRDGKQLQEAVNFLKKKGVEFWGINNNPEQNTWTKSPKVYANFYIDDASIGIPLTYPADGRPFVDWYNVNKLLIHRINDIEPVIIIKKKR